MLSGPLSRRARQGLLMSWSSLLISSLLVLGCGSASSTANSAGDDSGTAASAEPSGPVVKFTDTVPGEGDYPFSAQLQSITTDTEGEGYLVDGASLDDTYVLVRVAVTNETPDRSVSPPGNFGVACELADGSPVQPANAGYDQGTDTDLDGQGDFTAFGGGDSNTWIEIGIVPKDTGPDDVSCSVADFKGGPYATTVQGDPSL